ncbi:MAG TPA: hypothetical protein VIG99_03935 [Myxococcaceae bacterium]|jgi:hypothetical protein
MFERLPAIAALLMMSGCPSEFGRNGRIDQAVEQDLKVDPGGCPPGKHYRLPPSGCSGQECEVCVDDDGDSGR